MGTTNGMHAFSADELNRALDVSHRVYLSGSLARPQAAIAHVDSSFEMGVSSYETFTCDTPHVHPRNEEFNYIVAGETHVMDLRTETVHVLPAGSVFILEPGVAYVSKHAAGTRVVFFKAPGGDDKTVVEPSESARAWMAEKI